MNVKYCREIQIQILFSRAPRQEGLHAPDPRRHGRPRQGRRAPAGPQVGHRGPVRARQGHATVTRLLRRTLRSRGDPAEPRRQQGAQEHLGLHAVEPGRVRRLRQHHQAAAGARG